MHLEIIRDQRFICVEIPHSGRLMMCSTTEPYLKPDLIKPLQPNISNNVLEKLNLKNLQSLHEGRSGPLSQQRSSWVI